jgi:DNA-binding NarL/FixJ family response regulator
VKALTAKQKVVCDLLAQGFSNKEISTRLGISHRTVEAHRGEIFRKMGSETRWSWLVLTIPPEGREE